MKEYLWGNIGEDRWLLRLGAPEVEKLLMTSVPERDRNDVVVLMNEDGSAEIRYSQYADTRQS